MTTTISDSYVIERVRIMVGSTDPSLAQVKEALIKVLQEIGHKCYLTVKRGGEVFHRLEITGGKYAYLLHQAGAEVNVALPIECLSIKEGSQNDRESAVTSTITGLMRVLRWEGPRTFQLIPERL